MQTFYEEYLRTLDASDPDCNAFLDAILEAYPEHCVAATTRSVRVRAPRNRAGLGNLKLLSAGIQSKCETTEPNAMLFLHARGRKKDPVEMW